MTKTSITLLTIAVLLLGAVVVTAPLAASKPIAEAEDMACTACHDKPGSKRFTDRGKFYDLMGDFEGYEELTAKFGECTTCHKRRPGSTRLTLEGRRFAELHGDMEALCKEALEEKRAERGEKEAEKGEEGGGGAGSS